MSWEELLLPRRSYLVGQIPMIDGPVPVTIDEDLGGGVFMYNVVTHIHVLAAFPTRHFRS